jgi:hypothetical protein
MECSRENDTLIIFRVIDEIFIRSRHPIIKEVPMNTLFDLGRTTIKKTKAKSEIQGNEVTEEMLTMALMSEFRELSKKTSYYTNN